MNARSTMVMGSLLLATGCSVPRDQQHWTVWSIEASDCPASLTPGIGDEVYVGEASADAPFEVAIGAARGTCGDEQDDLRTCRVRAWYDDGDDGRCTMDIAIDKDRLASAISFLDMGPVARELDRMAVAKALVYAAPAAWPVYAVVGVWFAALMDGGLMDGDLMGY